MATDPVDPREVGDLGVPATDGDSGGAADGIPAEAEPDPPRHPATPSNEREKWRGTRVFALA